MKQSFIKTIKGHNLEFNRLLYPVRYNIVSQDFDPPGLLIWVNKDENGTWKIDSPENSPGWVSEVTADIYKIIEDNESSKQQIE